MINEIKLKEKIEDKIIEADNDIDEFITELELEAYKNGLKMALELINDVIAEESISKNEKDIVEIHCYNCVEHIERQKAIKKYLECMAMCEGAEQERYTNIYLGLVSGQKTIYDE